MVLYSCLDLASTVSMNINRLIRRREAIVNLCSWPSLMEESFAVGLYCNDVSGACGPKGPNICHSSRRNRALAVKWGYTRLESKCLSNKHHNNYSSGTFKSETSYAFAIKANQSHDSCQIIESERTGSNKPVPKDTCNKSRQTTYRRTHVATMN